MERKKKIAGGVATGVVAAMLAAGALVPAYHHDLPGGDQTPMRENARQRRVSYLYSDTPDKVDLQSAVTYWNQIAGWPILATTNEKALASANFIVTDTVSGGIAQHWAVPCQVGVDPHSAKVWSIVAHETGHCFGFHDHVDYHPANYGGSPGVAQCPYPFNPPSDEYEGIMSYCAKDKPYRQDDVDMLARAGMAPPHKWTSPGPGSTVRPSSAPNVTPSATIKPVPQPTPRPVTRVSFFCRWFKWGCPS